MWPTRMVLATTSVTVCGRPTRSASIVGGRHVKRCRTTATAGQTGVVISVLQDQPDRPEPEACGGPAACWPSRTRSSTCKGRSVLARSRLSRHRATAAIGLSYVGDERFPGQSRDGRTGTYSG
jgi:hypothetical protein